MKRLVGFLMSVSAVLTLPSAAVFAAAPPSAGMGRCGMIVIVGNGTTSHSFILDRVPLYPGMVLSESDLDAADRRLAATRLFRPAKNGRYVSLLDNLANPDSPYKDLQITIEERPFTRFLWTITECVNVRCTWPIHDLGLARWAAETLVGWASDGVGIWFPPAPATSAREVYGVGAPPCSFDLRR